MAISEGLKNSCRMSNCYQKKGRGKNPPPEIHASKGTEVFTPQFGDKYMLEVIVPDSKEDEVIKIVRQNTKIEKIFVYPVLRAFDIATGKKDEETIE